jgi:uncharacterized protein YidB (DUF937 family)
VAGTPFRPHDGPWRGSAVLAALAKLWEDAEQAGATLSQARLSRDAGVPRATLSDWATGKALPRDPVQVDAVAQVLAGYARQAAPLLQMWEQLVEADTARRPGRPSLGQLITRLDPFVLDVHRLIEADSGAEVLPALPPYARRAHDEALAAVVAAAAGGQSQLAVLVGGSSTGKTRACWEAVTTPGALPAGWRLWHPYDPTRPEALLEGLPAVAPRTVIWLNEAQLYLLEAPADAAERAAASLQTLLADSGRRPVLVLATLWPEYWDALTRKASTRRTLLEGRRITVPAAFTAAQAAALRQSGDPRLASAGAADSGQVAQFLAGAPVLLDRYRDAPPPAQAVIESAMDSRRLGHGLALPHALLKAAAPFYMSDADWDSAGDDWLEQALAFTAEPCKGTAGPVTRIRPRPAPVQAAGNTPPAPGGPAYKLADYLDQHGRRHRAAGFPPDEFWSAAAGCGSPGSQAALGAAARGRGLFRHAAQLRKNAARNGDPNAAAALIADMHRLDPTDQRAASWAVVHVSLDDPNGVVGLLERLRAVGASEQIAELAERAAAGVALDSPDGVAILLGTLQEVGTADQFTQLAERAAAGAALDNPFNVGILLDGLQSLGAGEQVAELVARSPAAAAVLDNPNGVVYLLECLRAVGASGQVAELAARAAANAALDNSLDLSRLLVGLQAAGADEQVNKLLARNPAVAVTLADLFGVARLLDSLRQVGAVGQVTELAARAAADAALDDPYGVASLLAGLRAAGADEQAARLLARNPAATVALDIPDGVAILLNAMREAGAEEQVTNLLGRNPAAAVALDDLSGVVRLMDRLREAAAAGQVTELTARAVAHTVLEDPLGVASLLDRLRAAGAEEQVTELLARNPAATVALDNQYSVERLLRRLRAADAAGQMAELTARLPAAGLFELHPDYGSLPYRFGREPSGRPAPAWTWADLD